MKPWWMRNDRGLSLMELLFSLAISLGVFSSTFALFVQGEKHLQRGDIVARLQQQQRTTMETILRDVSESAVDSIRISGAGGSALAFASARDDQFQYTLNVDKHPLWQKVIVYYMKADPHAPEVKNLYRYVGSKTDWSTPFLPDSVVQSGLGEPVLTHLSHVSFALVGDTLNISLGTDQEAPIGAAVNNALSTSVIVQNQL